MADLIRSGQTVSEEEKNEAIRDIFGGAQEYNKFYNGIAVVYRIAEFALLALFLLYIVVSAVSNAGKVTYDSLEYIVRNFAFTLDDNKEQTSEIIYDPDTSHSFSMFGKNFAVCGNSGVTIFSATGRRTCRETMELKDPVMAASGKYVIAYDNGSTEYSVFNSFSKVYTGITERPIRSIAVGNDGYYAIISSTQDYNSAVLLFDNDFNMVNRYRKNGYVISAALDGEGRIVIATLDVRESGEYVTELMLCEYGKETSETTVRVTEYFPLRCEFIKDGFCLVCDGGYFTFDYSGDKKAEYIYSGRTLKKFDTSDGAAMFLFAGNPMKKTVDAVIVSAEGDILSEKTITDTVLDIELFGSEGYVLKEEEIITISENTSNTAKIRRSGICDTLLAYADGRLYLCGKSAAYAVNAAEN